LKAELQMFDRDIHEPRKDARKGLTRSYFSLKITSKIKKPQKKMTATQAPAASNAGSELVRQLSAREREILTLLARGLSNKEIGVQLGLSPFTIRNHLARIFEKLQVRSRTEAAVAYLQGEETAGG
jgi:RNA polymerase sigma factor (sigma-70 family)